MYNILAREIVCVYLCVVVYVSEYGLCMAQRVFNIQMSERAKEGRQRRSNSVTGKVLKRTDFSTSTLCVCVCLAYFYSSFIIRFSIQFTEITKIASRLCTIASFLSICYAFVAERNPSTSNSHTRSRDSEMTQKMKIHFR